jgi:hypothetical protein
MRSRGFFLPVLLLLLLVNPSAAQSVTARCVDCHSKLTPNIVNDWKLSKHSQIDVGCDGCHGDQHTSAADAAKAKIRIRERFAHVRETRKHADKSVEAGREYVEAYVLLTHFVERLHVDAKGSVGHNAKMEAAQAEAHRD